MKQFFIILFLFVSVTLVAQTNEEKLIKTVKEFHQNLIKKNITSLNQQTDKALSYGHSNGWVENKTDFIKHIKSNFIQYNSITEDSIQVVLNDKLASVRFNATIDVNLKEVNGVYQLKVLEVWNKKGNRWILFARQAVKNINIK